MTKVFDQVPAVLYPITDPTRRKLAVALENTEAANEIVDALDAARSNTGQIIIPAEDFRKGITGPTDATIGSTPTIHVLLFDSVAELLSGHTMFPLDVDLTQPIQYILQVMLTGGQTDGDTLDIEMDYVVVQKNVTGAGFSKTSTNITASTILTTENGLATDDIYHVLFTLDPNDADNPFEGADGIGVEFHLANVVEVSSIHFAQACINYIDAHPGPSGQVDFTL